MRTKLARRARP